jgi:glycosyltransferase involved in cell wall biosynthesis
LSEPKVSLVVPVYNMGQFMQRAIESFLMQSEKDFEIIVCDNNSNDNTREIIESFSDERVRYFKNSSNIGFINNFNVGIKKARGKYISLISCDEFMVSEHSLKKRIDLLESKNEIDLVWCDYNLETYNLKAADGQLVYWPKINLPKNILTSADGIRAVFKDSLATDFRITTVIFRRQILEVSNYVLPLVHSGDKPIILEWMVRSRNVGYINEVLHGSYMHEEHRHDFFGKKHPYLGERDYLTVQFLDRHGPRLIAMGLDTKELEFLGLKNLFFTCLKISKIGSQGFAFYGCFLLQRFSKLFLSYVFSFILVTLYFPIRQFTVFYFMVRNKLSSINWVKSIYKKFF